MADMAEPVSGTASAAVGASKIAGFVVSETAGAAASFNLRDGGASGTIIFRVNLAANGTVSILPGGLRMNMQNGDCYAEVLSGTLRWTVVKV